MTTYSKGLENSKTNIEGFLKDMSRLFTAGVPTGFNSSSLQVVQRGAGANMSVDVSIGDAHLIRPTSDYSFYVWQDAATNVGITTAPATNSRIDAIVAWVDTSVTNTSLNNSPGSLKFSAIAGTVAGSPSAPIDSAIQTTLGSTVAWTRLANVTVGTGVTSIVTANIADQRSAIKVRAGVPTSAIDDASITTAKLGNASVTNQKLNLSGSAVATVSTSQASAIQTYHNSLATPGPAVTVTIGSSGLALVVITARLGSNSTTSGLSYVSFAISGANTRAASDDKAIAYQVYAANASGQSSYSELVSGLSAGSTTFTMNYRVPSDTGTFANRTISVIPL